MSTLRVCIYCLEKKPLTAFQGEDHVMPRAFGRFTDSPTLDCVCDACNGHFGKTIELSMARDSLEALLRLLHGTRPATKVKGLGRTRLVTTLDLDDPELKGCYVEWDEEDGEIVAAFVPQASFRRLDGRGWVHVTERDLKETMNPLPAEVYTSKEVRILSPSREIDERVVEALAGRGIRFTKVREWAGLAGSDDGLAPLDIRGRVDETILRCVGKIAFNYLTWRQGADFVRTDTFDALRAFVRYGTRAAYPLVEPHAKPILADDTVTERQTIGHLATAAWTPDNRHIVGQVSLFNSTTYAVSLSRDFTGTWRPLRIGHHFNIETRRIDLLDTHRPS